MMMQEFTERTGVTPTFQEYRDIEAEYYAFDGGKDAFCKAWMAASGPVKLYAARAHRIEQLEGCLMDDWYAIVETKEQAVELLEKAREKFRELGYELNQKTGVFPLQNGIDFCGFHLYLTKSGRVIRKLRQSSKKRMKRRIRRRERDFKEGKITRREIEDSFQAWNAHAKHGDTRVLRQQLRERVDKIFKEARNE